MITCKYACDHQSMCQQGHPPFDNQLVLTILSSSYLVRRLERDIYSESLSSNTVDLPKQS